MKVGDKIKIKIGKKVAHAKVVGEVDKNFIRVDLGKEGFPFEVTVNKKNIAE